MYEEIVKNIELNSDELSFMEELINNYNYSSDAERLLVEGILDKLSE